MGKVMKRRNQYQPTGWEPKEKRPYKPIGMNRKVRKDEKPFVNS